MPFLSVQVGFHCFALTCTGFGFDVFFFYFFLPCAMVKGTVPSANGSTGSQKINFRPLLASL